MARKSSFQQCTRQLLTVVVVLAGSAFAQLPGFTGNVPSYAPPFDMIGFIQKATLNSSSHPSNPKPSARTRGGSPR